MTAAVPLRPPAHRVDPAAPWLWVAQGVLFSTVLVALVVGLSLLLPEDVPAPVDTGLAIARWLLVPVVLGAVVVEPVWRYRVHRWEVTADAVYTLEGWL